MKAPLSKIKRLVFLCAGLLFVGLGFLGVFLPLLPTTPFVLLAAFCFARSSEKFHSWLLESKIFGGLIRDWERDGVIRIKTKWVASLLLVLTMSLPMFILKIPLVLKVLIAATGISVLGFIWSRPSIAPARRPKFDD